MKSTLFLYVDFLGFSELIKTPEKVEKLYKVIDKITLHRDINYQSIVFSDAFGLPSP